MGKWIILGAAAMDTVVRVPHLPKKDEIVYPLDIQYLPGGSAANVAAGLSRLGEAAAFFGKCGDDPAGAQIRESFNEDGVNTAGLIEKPGARSGGAFIAVDEAGERVIYSLGGEALYTDPDELDPAAFEGLTGLYLSEVFTDVALRAAELARRQGAKVFFGPGGIMCSYGLAELAPIISVSDCLLVNGPEALTLAGGDNKAEGSTADELADKAEGSTQSGCHEKEEAVRRLLEAGAGSVVLTEGKAGAGYYSREAVSDDDSHPGKSSGEPADLSIAAIHVPALDVPAVDTTGAGDTFTAGFLKAASLGLNPKDSLTFAAACAARAVQAVGARSSMPYLADVADFIKLETAPLES